MGESPLVWGIAVAMFVGQQILIFNPSSTAGAYLLPLVMKTVEICQGLVNMVTGDEFDGKNFNLYSLIPLSFIMVVAVFTMDRLLRKWAVGKVKDKAEVRTFAECFLRFVFYTWMFHNIMYVISLEDYWPNIDNCWPGAFDGSQERPLELQALYLFELSYYTSGVIIHIFLNEHLKDFGVMLTHHLLTILLLGFSFYFGYHRVGMLVLMCHDACDIFLDGGKIFNSFQKDAFATVTVASLIISWIYYRLYLFPYHVIYRNIIASFTLAWGKGHGPVRLWSLYVCYGMLIALVFLHVYWFILICKVAIRKLTKGDLKDVRQKGEKKTN